MVLVVPDGIGGRNVSRSCRCWVGSAWPHLERFIDSVSTWGAVPSCSQATFGGAVGLEVDGD